MKIFIGFKNFLAKKKHAGISQKNKSISKTSNETLVKPILETNL